MNRSALLVGVLTLCIGVPAHAQTTIDRDSLRGLRSVVVVLEDLPKEAEGHLASAQLQTDVELRLRRAGMRVLDEPDVDSGLVCLNIAVTLAPTGGYRGLLAYGIRVSLTQSVSLRRDPTIVLADATTWEKTVVGLVGMQQVHNLRGFVGDLTDRFVNDYLAANPAGR